MPDDDIDEMMGEAWIESEEPWAGVFPLGEDDVYTGLRATLGADYRELPPDHLDAILNETLSRLTPAEAEGFLDTLKDIGKAVLPVAAPLIGTAIGGPAGAAIGSMVGKYAGQALG